MEATLSNTESDMLTLQEDLKTYDKYIYITTMLFGTLATFISY